ncbi:type IX secretion system protein PorQ [Bacteroidota bacterium]
MFTKRIILLIAILGISLQGFSQLGGQSTYSFLELPYSARCAALGNNMVPIYDKDLTLAINNPSLLNEDMNGKVNLTYSNYLADVNFGNASFGHTFKNKIYSIASIRYINYGDFIEADEFGNIIGQFSAGEYALNFAAATAINANWTTGAGLKLIYSSFEQYNSSGIATDYAISYHSDDMLFTSSFLISNLGFQIKPYSPGNREPLPLNLQLGLSKKFEHMPLRFIMVAHHLNKFNFAYVDPNKQIIRSFDGTTEEEDVAPFSEKLFRHFIFAGEFVLSENLHFRVGYNHQRRKELQLATRPGLAGYSWGFGIRISKFYLSYGNTIYHLAGGSHMFSVTITPSEFLKKNKVDDKLQ